MSGTLPRELHDPVRLPGLAAVGGTGLLPARRSGRDRGPQEASAHRLPVLHVVGAERTDAVHEGAAHRRADRPGGVTLVEPPDRPLAALLVPGAQADGAIGS